MKISMLDNVFSLKILGLFLVFCLVLSTLLAIENGYFKPLFTEIGVYPVDEKYTSLFFVDSEKLSVGVNELGLNTFSFGITNHEGKNLVYGYTVNLSIDGKIFTQIDSFIYVQSGETIYKSVEIDKQMYVKGSRVYVLLPEKSQSISFEVK